MKKKAKAHLMLEQARRYGRLDSTVKELRQDAELYVKEAMRRYEEGLAQLRREALRRRRKKHAAIAIGVLTAVSALMLGAYAIHMMGVA